MKKVISFEKELTTEEGKEIDFKYISAWNFDIEQPLKIIIYWFFNFITDSAYFNT